MDNHRNNEMPHHWHHGHGGREDPAALLSTVGVREGMNVADLGSGAGYYTIPIASMVGSEGRVIAVDADPGSLITLKKNASKQNVSNVRIVLSDLEMLPFKPNVFDMVFLANVFHDINDRKNFLVSLKRIVKPDGFIVDLDWDDVPTIFGPPVSIRISEKRAEEEFTQGGFEVISAKRVENHHYVLTAKPA